MSGNTLHCLLYQAVRWHHVESAHLGTTIDLPVELYRYILACVSTLQTDDDTWRSTLVSCALVCKGFRDICYAHLFHHLAFVVVKDLNDEAQVKNFPPTLSQEKRCFYRYVTTCEDAVSYLSSQDTIASSVRRLTLHMDHPQISRDSTIGHPLFHVLMKIMTSLEHLEHLRLVGIMLEQNEQASSADRHTRTSSSEELHPSYAFAGIGRSGSVAISRKLRTLRFSNFCISDEHYLDNTQLLSLLLAHIGPDLEYLSLGEIHLLAVLEFGGSMYKDTRIDFNPCKKLHTVALHINLPSERTYSFPRFDSENHIILSLFGLPQIYAIRQEIFQSLPLPSLRTLVLYLHDLHSDSPASQPFAEEFWDVMESSLTTLAIHGHEDLKVEMFSYRGSDLGALPCSEAEQAQLRARFSGLHDVITFPQNAPASPLG